ncbi:MAG: HlyC/CorC family transporter, partial [Cryobacterium sp.]|nr:HlyC/CorC family transporter [Oligoflexia bacterium]
MSQLSTELLISLLIPLILIEGFFSGSEIALLSADQIDLKARAANGSSRAKLALQLAKHPERVLTSTLVMTAFCVILISALCSLWARGKYGESSEWIAVSIASPLVVILGELIPKTVYQKYANRVAPWVSYPVSFVYLLFYPLTRTISFYTSGLSRVLRPIEEMLTGKSPSGRDELLTLLSYGKRESELGVSEKRMIRRIFDFKGTEAKHILIPLIKVEAIEEHATILDGLERFKSHRHSRMPVYSGRIDNIVGILEVSDLFRAPDPQQSVRNFVETATYVAETHHLDDLLKIMRRDETEMVVIVDEYGGAIGILTFEDIVEEIVGEIEDEHDDQAVDVKQLGENSYIVPARMEVTALNENLNFEIPE